MTTPHPHADKLIAIAEGKQMQHMDSKERWEHIGGNAAAWYISQEEGDKIRIAPETILVNGVECAKNFRVAIKPSSDKGYRLAIFGKFDRWIYFDTAEQRDQAEAATIAPFKS